MERKRIAIACQGGGSQCAFVAGALRALVERGVRERFQIIGLSGTSGGALTAAVAWAGLLKQARGQSVSVGDEIIALWKDLGAQTPMEIAFDRFCVQLVRLVERGVLPSFASSPSSTLFRLWSDSAARLIGRAEFTDLGALLRKHIDFGTLPSLVQQDSPVLLVGAGDVIEGTLKIFSSARGEIKVESLQASAAIPTLFPAVWVDGHAYWDGIFASNPPVVGFLKKSLMAGAPLPHEIWIIQINRSRHLSVPETATDITDRRNHLAGNLSLLHELEFVDVLNMMIQQGALSDQFRAHFGVDMMEPIKVRFIRMSRELQEGLDYPSKLSRQPDQIDRLIADGETQAAAFLEEAFEGEAAPDQTAAAALAANSGAHPQPFGAG